MKIVFTPSARDQFLRGLAYISRRKPLWINHSNRNFSNISCTIMILEPLVGYAGLSRYGSEPGAMDFSG